MLLCTVLFDYGSPRSYTGVRYPFMLKGEQWYVHQIDAQRSPKLWKISE